MLPNPFLSCLLSHSCAYLLTIFILGKLPGHTTGSYVSRKLGVAPKRLLKSKAVIMYLIDMQWNKYTEIPRPPQKYISVKKMKQVSRKT